jgi:hypothetical protein
MIKSRSHFTISDLDLDSFLIDILLLAVCGLI